MSWRDPPHSTNGSFKIGQREKDQKGNQEIPPVEPAEQIEAETNHKAVVKLADEALESAGKVIKEARDRLKEATDLYEERRVGHPRHH